MDLNFSDLQNMGSKIIILTGTRGRGKTAACQKWVQQAGMIGWNVSGLLCPAVFENGAKTGIIVKNLATGESRHLAGLVDGTVGEVATDHWNFDPEVLKWGSQVLGEIRECDLLIVDELGPLEFYRRQGWVEAFDVLGGGVYRLAVVVIRPELLDEARIIWPGASVCSLDEL
ncbi:MAG: nucleoside-triphosphatase [Leptolinea sp.]